MNTHHPAGVLGAKPRLPKADGNGETSKAALARLSREYLEIRNRQQRAKAFLVETQAAKQRGELLDKKWVKDSLQYIGACFRQRSLLAPSIIARKLFSLGFVAEADEHAVSQVLLNEIRGLLTELAHLAEKGTDPNWLKELERQELGLDEKERQKTPREHKAEQARAARRRERKTETQRDLRAKG